MWLPFSKHSTGIFVCVCTSPYSIMFKLDMIVSVIYGLEHEHLLSNYNVYLKERGDGFSASSKMFMLSCFECVSTVTFSFVIIQWGKCT